MNAPRQRPRPVTRSEAAADFRARLIASSQQVSPRLAAAKSRP